MTATTSESRDHYFFERVVSTAGHNAGINLLPLMEECARLDIPATRWKSDRSTFEIVIPLPSPELKAAVEASLAPFDSIRTSFGSLLSTSGESVFTCRVGQGIDPVAGRYSAYAVSRHLDTDSGRQLVRAAATAFAATHEGTLTMPLCPPHLMTGAVCLEREGATATSEQLARSEAQLYTVDGAASLFLPFARIPDDQVKDVLQLCGEVLRAHGRQLINISSGEHSGVLVQVPEHEYNALRALAFSLGLQIVPDESHNHGLNSPS